MKKKSLLPETDLARVALLPDDLKRIQLFRIKFAKPKFTYGPVRSSVPTIFNARPDLIQLSKETWEGIQAGIERKCVKSPDSLAPCLAIAKPLFEFAERNSFDAYHHDFNPVAIGRGAKIGMWHDFYYVENGKPVICYLDPRRRANGLESQAARDFMFSVMHHNLAVDDFSEAQFRIFRFLVGENDTRVLQSPYSFDPSRLISAEVINKAIDSTYNMWSEILDEREEKARKNPKTGTGGLFGW